MNNNLLSQKIISILKEYRNDLIISKINYRFLKWYDKDDIRVFNEILKFDDKDFCFNGNNDLDIFIGYINFGIYFDKDLVGYFGFCDHSLEIDDTYSITLILREDYRNCKIGDVVLKQMISYIFDNYDYINNLYASILNDNIASRKLLVNNFFKEISSEDSLFCKDVLCKQYVFNKKKYSRGLNDRYSKVYVSY